METQSAYASAGLLTSESGRFFLGPNRAVVPKPIDKANLQSGARNATNAPESAICRVLPNRTAPNRTAPTGFMPWLVPISFPRIARRRVAGPIYGRLAVFSL